MSIQTEWITERRDHDDRSTELVDISKLWAEKVEELSTKVRAIARGDDDFHQEGLLGIREGLLRDPYATDSYLLQAAKFSMNNYRNRGRSVDNGSRHATTKRLLDGTIKTYRKNMVPVHIDKLASEFELELPNYSFPPDVLALDMICAERFYNSLDEEEAELVDACIQALDRRSYNLKVMQNKVRKAVYDKFIRAFGTDEEVGILCGRKALEEVAC